MDFQDGQTQVLNGVTYVRQGGQWHAQSGATTGPIYGSAPKPEKPQVRMVGDTLGVVGDNGTFTPTYTAPEKPKEPSLPTGYRMGPNGTAERIPGLPEDKAASGDVKMQQKRASLDSLVTQINRVDELYRKGFRDEAMGLISSLGEYLPSDKASQFDAASAGLAEQGMSAFRVPGVGAQSDTELRQFVEANKPTSWDRDTAVEEKLLQLRTRVDATRKEMGLPAAQWSGAPAASDSGNVVYNGNLGGEPVTPSTNGYRTVDDPKLAGVRGEYLARLGRGDSATDILGFLRSAGITDPKVLRSAAEQVAFRRKNPNVPIEKYNTSALDDMDVPLSGVENAMNAAAQSAPGAYMMQAGNAVTANNLDSIAGALGGNEERARLALQYADRQHPGASLAGNLSGGVMAAMGGEAALARGGMAAGLGRSVAADAGYGAIAGAGAADGGDRATGALYGIGAGLAGSLGGNALMRGVGAVVSPRGGNVNALYEAGVRPTPGQRLVNAGDGKGVKGLVGKAVNASEEGLQSVPILGSAIRGARQEARDQFQVGAFNHALGELGMKLPKGVEAGTKAHAYAQRAFDHAYNKAREGLKLVADEELSNDLADLSGSVGNLAKPSIDRFNTILQNVVIRRASGPELTGAAFKDVQKDLGKTIRGIRKSQSGDGELADALEDLQHVLDSAARRHSDPDAVKLLDRADRGYAKFVRIEEASKAGGAMKDAGTFSPADLAGAVKRSETRVRSKAYSQGEALMQDYADQGKALADRVPNSGTPERVAIGTVAAGGLGYVEPTALTLMGALTAAYAPGGRRIVKGMMTPRGEKATAIANRIRSKSGLVGHAAGSQAALNGPKP